MLRSLFLQLFLISCIRAISYTSSDMTSQAKHFQTMQAFLNSLIISWIDWHFSSAWPVILSRVLVKQDFRVCKDYCSWPNSYNAIYRWHPWAEWQMIMSPSQTWNSAKFATLFCKRCKIFTECFTASTKQCCANVTELEVLCSRTVVFTVVLLMCIGFI